MTSTPEDAPQTGGRRRAESTRPAYLRAPGIVLVLIGGGLGAGCREALMLWIPAIDDVPVVVPVANVVGAFLLGLLYEGLTRTDPGPTRTAQLKALIGTGFCGGLTTYSSLTTDTAVLLYDGRPTVGALYALGTVVVGAGATVLGIAAGSRLRPLASADGGQG